MNLLPYKHYSIVEHNTKVVDDCHRVYNQYFHENPMDHRYHNKQTKSKNMFQIIDNELFILVYEQYLNRIQIDVELYNYKLKDVVLLYEVISYPIHHLRELYTLQQPVLHP